MVTLATGLKDSLGLQAKFTGRVTLLPARQLYACSPSVTLQVKHEQITKLENYLFPKQKYDKL